MNSMMLMSLKVTGENSLKFPMLFKIRVLYHITNNLKLSMTSIIKHKTKILI